jgi:hypothetical protein
MSRFSACLALLLLVCGVPVWNTALSAESPVPLAFKFGAGDILRYDVSFSGGGGVTVPGSEVSVVGIQGTLSVVQKVVEVLADGSGRLETTIPRVQVEVTVGQDKASFTFADGKLRWFANGKEAAPPEDAALKNIPLLMAPVVVTVTPNGRTAGLSFADPQLLSQLSQALPGLDLSKAVEADAAVFPDTPVSVGESWRQNTQYLPLGPRMPVTVSTSRTLDSYTEQAGMGVAKISGFADARVRGTGELAAPGGVGVSVPELRQTITSTEFFNATKGQLLRGDYDIGFHASFGMKLGEEQKSGAVEARLRVSVQAR